MNPNDLACCATELGMVCTLEPGHLGDHEAWAGGDRPLARWRNRRDAVTDGRHLFQQEDQGCGPCQVRADAPLIT